MSICEYKEPEYKDSQQFDLPEGVPPLRSFYLYLSNSCNLTCRHCWITPKFINGMPDPGDVIDVAALRNAISEAKPLGLNSVKLTGGEPLLHPGFHDICDMVTKEDLVINIETNGTLLSADMARYLKDETSMEFISISIDSSIAANHDAFRGIDGAFDAALQGLDHLVAAGCDNVQVVMSVHRGNREEIEDVARLAAAHGAESIKLNPVTDCGRGAVMEMHGETLSFEERLALDHYIFKELSSILQRDGIHIDIQLHTPPALMPLGEIIRRKGNASACGILGVLGFLGSGEIAMCGIGRNIPELVYGCLGQDSIHDIWVHHPTLIKLRHALKDVDNYPNICRECTMAKNCRTGCVAQNFQNSKQVIWPDSLCLKAHQKGLFPMTRQKMAN